MHSTLPVHEGPRPAGPDPAAAERRATWLELFFDLVFAAAVGQIGSALAASFTPRGLPAFGFAFGLVWWAWIGHTFFSTRFDDDHPAQRLLTLGQVFMVAVMAANAGAELGTRETAGFAAAYAGMRLLLAAQYLRVLRRPEARGLAARYAAGILVGAGLWLASAVVEAPLRFGLWAAAAAIELATPLAARPHAARHPPDPAHLPERFGLFTLILLGESVIGVMAGMQHQEVWTLPAAASAGIGLGLAFALWWAYFHLLGAAQPRSGRSAVDRARRRIWLIAHLPLCLGIAVTAAGIEVVIARDGIMPLERPAAALLAGGLALAVGSLGALGAASGEAGRHRVRPAAGVPLVTVAALVLGLGWWLASGPPVLLLLAWLAAIAAGMARRPRPRPG